MEILREEWLWIIILSLIAIFLIPLILVWFILAITPELRVIITLILIIGWSVAAGYRDWLIEKQKEETHS